MSKVFSYSRTMAGAKRIAEQREAKTPSAIILPFKPRPVTAYAPLRIPSSDEVSRARHLAYLEALNTKQRSPEDIIRRVSAWHDLSIGDIMSTARYRHIVEARTDCIAAVHKAYPTDTLQGLATIFRRDHTAVLAALRKRGLK